MPVVEEVTIKMHRHHNHAFPREFQWPRTVRRVCFVHDRSNCVFRYPISPDWTFRMDGFDPWIDRSKHIEDLRVRTIINSTTHEYRWTGAEWKFLG